MVRTRYSKIPDVKQPGSGTNHYTKLTSFSRAKKWGVDSATYQRHVALQAARRRRDAWRRVNVNDCILPLVDGTRADDSRPPDQQHAVLTLLRNQEVVQIGLKHGRVRPRPRRRRRRRALTSHHVASAAAAVAFRSRRRARTARPRLAKLVKQFASADNKFFGRRRSTTPASNPRGAARSLLDDCNCADGKRRALLRRRASSPGRALSAPF